MSISDLFTRPSFISFVLCRLKLQLRLSINTGENESNSEDYNKTECFLQQNPTASMETLAPSSLAKLLKLIRSCNSKSCKETVQLRCIFKQMIYFVLFCQ